MAENVEEAPSSPRVLQGSEQKKETFIKLKPKMIKELKLNSELNGKQQRWSYLFLQSKHISWIHMLFWIYL